MGYARTISSVAASVPAAMKSMNGPLEETVHLVKRGAAFDRVHASVSTKDLEQALGCEGALIPESLGKTVYEFTISNARSRTK